MIAASIVLAVEVDSMKSIMVRMDDLLAERVKAKAAGLGWSVNAAMVVLVEEWVRDAKEEAEWRAAERGIESKAKPKAEAKVEVRKGIEPVVAQEIPIGDYFCAFIGPKGQCVNQATYWKGNQARCAEH